MKAISDFYTTESSIQLLSVNEMINTRGGETPPPAEGDPFRKKINSFFSMFSSFFAR